MYSPASAPPSSSLWIFSSPSFLIVHVLSMYAPFVPVPKMAPISAGPFWYERDRSVPTVCGSAVCPDVYSSNTRLERPACSPKGTHIIDQRTAAHVHVLAVERVLEQAHDVVADGVLGSESLRPRQELASVERSLLDGEPGCQRGSSSAVRSLRANRRRNHEDVRDCTNSLTPATLRAQHNSRESETQVQRLILVHGDLAPKVGQEGVDRVGDVVCVSADRSAEQ